MFSAPGRGASMNRRTSEQYLEQLVAWGPAPSKPVQSAGRVSSMQCGCPAPTSSIMPVCNSSLFAILPTLYCDYLEPMLANGVYVWVVTVSYTHRTLQTNREGQVVDRL